MSSFAREQRRRGVIDLIVCECIVKQEKKINISTSPGIIGMVRLLGVHVATTDNDAIVEAHTPSITTKRLMVRMVPIDAIDTVRTDVITICGEDLSNLVKTHLPPTHPKWVISIDTESRQLNRPVELSDKSQGVTDGGGSPDQYRLLEVVVTVFCLDGEDGVRYQYRPANRIQLFLRPSPSDGFIGGDSKLVRDARQRGVDAQQLHADLLYSLQAVSKFGCSADDILLLAYNLEHEQKVLASIGFSHRFWNDMGIKHVEDVLTRVKYSSFYHSGPINDDDDAKTLPRYGLETVWMNMVFQNRSTVHSESLFRSAMQRQYTVAISNENTGTGKPGNNHSENLNGFGFHRATTDSRAAFEIWAVCNGFGLS
jgi:hypothetical protein